METLKPTPQSETQGQPIPDEFDHLLVRGPEQHLTVEDAAVRPEDSAGASTSRARAEVERGAKLGDLNAIYGPIEEPKARQ